MTVAITVLDNGLTVVSDRMEHVASVSLGVWVAAGARAEAADINGAAHFLEHMAFKGTKRRSARQIAEEIEAVGGHLNAYTARESTAYYVRLLARDLALGVDILADILQHPTFDADELERERSVILQEIGQCHDVPEDLVFDHFQTCAYPGQPMGRPILGSAETVRAMPRTALRRFMAERYVGGRMVLAAAGQVAHDRLVALAGEAFDALGTDGVPDADAPARYGGGVMHEPRDSEQLHFLMGFPGPAYGDDTYYPVAILNMLFGGGMSSRLFQEAREKQGLAYAIYSFTSAFRDSGLFGIYAGAAPQDAEALVTCLNGEIERLLRDGVTQTELDRARTQITAGLMMGQESCAARCEQLAHHMLVHGRPLPLAERIERLERVDAPAVRDAARQIFAAPVTVAALGPLANPETLTGIPDHLASRAVHG